jgi:hypothetical protein
MDDIIRAALQSLLEELRTLEDALALLETERTAVRDQIRQHVEQLGGRAVLPGYGRLEITTPGITVSYDRRQVEALIIELTTTAPVIAARLAACRTESAHRGGLRITPAHAAA